MDIGASVSASPCACMSRTELVAVDGQMACHPTWRPLMEPVRSGGRVRMTAWRNVDHPAWRRRPGSPATSPPRIALMARTELLDRLDVLGGRTAEDRGDHRRADDLQRTERPPRSPCPAGKALGLGRGRLSITPNCWCASAKRRVCARARVRPAECRHPRPVRPAQATPQRGGFCPRMACARPLLQGTPGALPPNLRRSSQHQPKPRSAGQRAARWWVVARKCHLFFLSVYLFFLSVDVLYQENPVALAEALQSAGRLPSKLPITGGRYATYDLGKTATPGRERFFKEGVLRCRIAAC